MDGANLTTSTTLASGKYSFSYPIPNNASWLGAHAIQARAATPNGTLYSGVVQIQIVLIPTSIKLTPSSLVMTYEDILRLDVTLRDNRQRPLPDAPCYIIVDSSNISFATDDGGSFVMYRSGSELDYGTHTMQAFYIGELPYAPSSSAIVTVTVDIPTNVTVNLFSERFFTSHYIVGNGTLVANASTPLPAQKITISIDGVPMANVTTDSQGVFGFLIPASQFPAGTHILRAAFLERDYIWRYSQDEVAFSIFSQKVGKYPFFPSIPGWGGGIPETIPYLFFGEYAYFTWLLVLALIGIAIRILQTKKRKFELAKRAEHELLVSMEGAKEATGIAAAGPEAMTIDVSDLAVSARTPNERIVMYYHRLLEFLTKRRRIDLRESMTHWEVARLLRTLGYPDNHVEKVTVLFERALYSGTDLADSDTVQMTSSLGELVITKLPGVVRAV